MRFLCKVKGAINQVPLSHEGCRDLLNIAFCRTLIGLSNAAFNHQSMSFKDGSSGPQIQVPAQLVVGAPSSSCRSQESRYDRTLWNDNRIGPEASAPEVRHAAIGYYTGQIGVFDAAGPVRPPATFPHIDPWSSCLITKPDAGRHRRGPARSACRT